MLDDQIAHRLHPKVIPANPIHSAPDLLADAIGQVFAAVFRIERGDEFARLISCKAKDRVKILRRLVGEWLPALAEIERRYFEAMEADERHEFEFPTSALTLPVVAEPAEAPTPSAPPQPPQPNVSLEQPLTITSEEHIPSQLSPMECRVTRQRSSGPRTLSGSRRVTDWVFCERKVIEFEEHATPPRFPVRVNNVTGWKAPGVRYPQFFRPADERQRFLDSENKDSTLVARFIEVKGRSAEGAKIDLRGNELTAAPVIEAGIICIAYLIGATRRTNSSSPRPPRGRERCSGRSGNQPRRRRWN